MSNYLMDESPLVLLPSLAKKIGLNEAIFMQQLHYWLIKRLNQREGYYWTYNTYKGWTEQFPFWSESTVKRTVTALESRGLIITGNYNKMKQDNTKWYRINYKSFNALFADIEVFDGSVKSDNSNQEIGQVNMTRGTGQLDPRDRSIWSGHDEVNMTRAIPYTTHDITTDNTTDIKTLPTLVPNEVEEGKKIRREGIIKQVTAHYKTLPKLPGYRSLTAQRRSAIYARTKEIGLEEMKEVLTKINETTFFYESDGKTKNWFTLDWIFNPTNFNKILEGKYWNENAIDYGGSKYGRNRQNIRETDDKSFFEAFGYDPGF